MEKLRQQTWSISRFITASTSGHRLFSARCLGSVAGMPGTQHYCEPEGFPIFLMDWVKTHPVGTVFSQVFFPKWCKSTCLETKISIWTFCGNYTLYVNFKDLDDFSLAPICSFYLEGSTNPSKRKSHFAVFCLNTFFSVYEAKHCLHHTYASIHPISCNTRCHLIFPPPGSYQKMKFTELVLFCMTRLFPSLTFSKFLGLVFFNLCTRFMRVLYIWNA